jgi:hypothetical protein
VLWISISRACDELKPSILAALKGLVPADNRDGRLGLEGEPKAVLALLEKALEGSDCVAVENMQDESEIAVLKKGDIEQLGLYLCGYCAMVFGSDLERNLHQRVHYFGFGWHYHYYYHHHRR